VYAGGGPGDALSLTGSLDDPGDGCPGKEEEGVGEGGLAPGGGVACDGGAPDSCQHELERRLAVSGSTTLPSSVAYHSGMAAVLRDQVISGLEKLRSSGRATPNGWEQRALLRAERNLAEAVEGRAKYVEPLDAPRPWHDGMDAARAYWDDCRASKAGCARAYPASRAVDAEAAETHGAEPRVDDRGASIFGGSTMSRFPPSGICLSSRTGGGGPPESCEEEGSGVSAWQHHLRERSVAVAAVANRFGLRGRMAEAYATAVNGTDADVSVSARIRDRWESEFKAALSATFVGVQSGLATLKATKESAEPRQRLKRKRGASTAVDGAAAYREWAARRPPPTGASRVMWPELIESSAGSSDGRDDKVAGAEPAADQEAAPEAVVLGSQGHGTAVAATGARVAPGELDGGDKGGGLGSLGGADLDPGTVAPLAAHQGRRSPSDTHIKEDILKWWDVTADYTRGVSNPGHWLELGGDNSPPVAKGCVSCGCGVRIVDDARYIEPAGCTGPEGRDGIVVISHGKEQNGAPVGAGQDGVAMRPPPTEASHRMWPGQLDSSAGSSGHSDETVAGAEQTAAQEVAPGAVGMGSQGDGTAGAAMGERVAPGELNGGYKGCGGGKFGGAEQSDTWGWGSGWDGRPSQPLTGEEYWNEQRRERAVLAVPIGVAVASGKGHDTGTIYGTMPRVSPSGDCLGSRTGGGGPPESCVEEGSVASTWQHQVRV